jgi:hypothetical protein
MGPSLARRIRRAMDAAGNSAKVITVSRGALEIEGVEHIRCDMLAPGALETLPDAPSVFYLAARKFGSTGNPSETWAANVLLPGLVSRRYRASRIVSFSTGNVYPLVPVESGGATEETLMDPVGEYAWSATGRERMFDYAARTLERPSRCCDSIMPANSATASSSISPRRSSTKSPSTSAWAMST